MTMPSDLPSFIGPSALQQALRRRTDLREPGWTFWELRTLNRHRVVGLLNEYRQFGDAHDLEVEIRGVVSRNFKTSWWRGMAYGVVAQVDGLMKFLTGVADWETALLSLGTREKVFHEFRDHP